MLSQIALLAGFVSVCLTVGIGLMIYGELSQARRVTRRLRLRTRNARRH